MSAVVSCAVTLSFVLSLVTASGRALAQEAPAPVPVPAATEPVPSPIVPERPPPESLQDVDAQRRTRERQIFLGLIIGGGAMLAVGIGLGIAAKSKYREYDDTIGTAWADKGVLGTAIKLPDGSQPIKDRADKLTIGAAVIGFAGFVALDVALAMALTRRFSKRAEVAIVPSHDGARAAFTVSF
jgi:hypothetical protein